MRPKYWRLVGLGPHARTRSSTRQRLQTLFISCLAACLFLWLLLPYDNTVRLAVRFIFKQLQDVSLPCPSESWVYDAHPEFPTDLSRDVVLILKTGYGTRDRVPGWFEALGNSSEFRDIFVTADYSSRPGEHFTYRGQELPVHDMVNRSLSLPVLAPYQSHPRALRYKQLYDAIEAGDETFALQLSKSFGWELDALKDLSCLELAHSLFPFKKWFLLLDDDTFLLPTSLSPLLGHLNPSRPHYLGNAVGDFRIRFAHGGSGVLLSRAALSLLFTSHPGALDSVHRDSLIDIWGDRLIAKALLKVGVYLDERYSHLFNGEPPRLTKIRADRLCSPVLGFHRVRGEGVMREAAGRFGRVSGPVLWGDLWRFFGEGVPWRETEGEEGEGGEEGEEDGVREGWDYVGELGGDPLARIVEGIETAERCRRNCEGRSWACLAWTWESEARRCYISPWMIVGGEAKEKITGVNVRRVRELERKCIRY